MTTEAPSVERYHHTLSWNAVAKRFYERWVADPGFRSELAEDLAGTLERRALDLRPEDVEALVRPGGSEVAPVTRAMWQVTAEKSQWVDRFYRRSGTPSDARVRAWRSRQILRQRLDLGPYPTAANIHASWCAELAKGCSGACWFCAVSAQRLTGVFARNEEGEALWKGMLGVLDRLLGPAARTGFLYWATDPLDNPDYERLCLDMYEVLGVFPPTTTAFPLRDPTRVRGLLALAQDRGCWLNRFSILSIRLMERVHAEYTADELAWVECLPLNREAAFSFGNAGRFRERALQDPELLDQQRQNLRWAPWYTDDPAYRDDVEYPLGSIGCVTGFLFNMVDRTVQLISPTTADDHWPDGLIVFERATFSDATDLADVLERMVERWMPLLVRAEDRVRFADFLRYEPRPDGFGLVGRHNQEVIITDPERARHLRLLGDLVAEGSRTAGAIAVELGADGVPAARAQGDLDRLLHAGVLDQIAMGGS